MATRSASDRPGAAAARVMNPAPDRYWSESPDDLLNCLGATPQGLGTSQVVERLARFGPNAIDVREDIHTLRLLARQFISPLVLILVFGAAVSFYMRDWVDGASLAIVAGYVWLTENAKRHFWARHRQVTQ